MQISRNSFDRFVYKWNGNNVTYFDSFGVEYNPKEIKKFTGNRTIEIQQIFIENRPMIR